MGVEIKKVEEAIQQAIQELEIPPRLHVACRAALETGVLKLKKMSITHAELENCIIPFVNSFNITTLNLSCNYTLGDSGAIIIASALKKTTTLSTLIVQNNQIGDEGAIALGTIKNLRVLNMRSNHVGPKGAAGLAKGAIHTVELSYNRLTDQGAERLAKSETICILKVRANNIRVDGARAFSNMCSLEHLDISDNYIEAIGAKILVNNLNIKTIKLSNTGIEEGDIDTFEYINQTLANNQKKARLALTQHLPWMPRELMPIVFSYHGIAGNSYAVLDTHIEGLTPCFKPCKKR